MDYTQATLFQPNFAHAYTRRGMLKSDFGDVDGAMADCEIALNLAEEQEIQVIKTMITDSLVSIPISEISNF